MKRVGCRIPRRSRAWMPPEVVSSTCTVAPGGVSGPRSRVMAVTRRAFSAIQGAAEEDQRIELVLPALPLDDEVDEPVERAHQGQPLARGLPRRGSEQREQGQDQE